MEIVEYGLYNIKDEYFKDYESKYFVDNKNESRPFYCTFKDKNGVIWVIPLSTQLDAYKEKICKDLESHKECIFYHTGDVGGKERVFLIGNMFPITINYIKKPFTIHNYPYVIQNKELIKSIHKRASKYLAMVKTNKLTPNLDIMGIYNSLKNT